jgi:hypothetical protein
MAEGVSRSDYTYASTSTIFDNILTYDQRWKKHTLNLVSGISFTRVESEFTSISSTNFQDDYVLNNLGSAGAIQSYSSGGGISGLSSYFLRSITIIRVNIMQHLPAGQTTPQNLVQTTAGDFFLRERWRGKLATRNLWILFAL